MERARRRLRRRGLCLARLRSRVEEWLAPGPGGGRGSAVQSEVDDDGLDGLPDEQVSLADRRQHGPGVGRRVKVGKRKRRGLAPGAATVRRAVGVRRPVEPERPALGVRAERVDDRGVRQAAVEVAQDEDGSGGEGLSGPGGDDEPDGGGRREASPAGLGSGGGGVRGRLRAERGEGVGCRGRVDKADEGRLAVCAAGPNKVCRERAERVAQCVEFCRRASGGRGGGRRESACA